MADKPEMATNPGNAEKVEVPIQNNIFTVLLFAACLIVATASVVVISQSQKLYGTWWGESQDLKTYQADLDKFKKNTAGTGFSGYDVGAGQ